MIFFGTGHYSKRNPQHRHGICESCGRAGQLHSYNCTQFAHLYWIPIIPLGSKRIMDQCPSCKAGREMSLGEYKKLHTETLLPAIEELRIKPTDKEAGMQALALATQFGSKEEFIEVVGMMAHHHTNDSEVLAQVGLGFNRFNMREDAEKLLSASLKLKEDDDLRQFLDFIKGQRDSKPPKTPGKIAQIWPVMITPLIILTVVVSLAYIGSTNKPKNIFAVNGLWQPYSILVNGEKILLPAQSKTRLHIDYGPVEIREESGELESEPIHYDLKSSFSTRLGGGPALVFNLDRSAVLVREQIIYSEAAEQSATNNNPFKLFTGKAQYLMSNIDHFFENPPKQVSVSSSGGSTTRSYVYQLNADNPIDMATLLLNSQAPKDALTFCKTILDIDPDQDALLAYVVALGKPDENAAYFSSHINEQPTQIDWHRMYQSAVEQISPDNDLEAEYRRRLDKHPGDGALAYLLGRVTDDNEAAMKLFQKAAASSEKTAAAYGFNAIAFEQMQNGEFAKALVNTRKALKLMPGKYNFVALETELMLGTKDFTEIIKRNQAALKDKPLAQDKLIALIQAQASSGAANDAKKSLIAYISRLKKEGGIDAQTIQQIKMYCSMVIAISTQDTDEYIKLAKKVGDDRSIFSALMVEGKYSEAGTILKKLADASYNDHLLLYIAEKSANHPQPAAIHLANGIAAIKKDPALGETAAAFFTKPPSSEDVLDVIVWPNKAIVIFSALGYKYPESSRVYFEQAQQFNYKPEFPKPLLDKILQSK